MGPYNILARGVIARSFHMMRNTADGRAEDRRQESAAPSQHRGTLDQVASLAQSSHPGKLCWSVDGDMALRCAKAPSRVWLIDSSPGG